MTTTGLTHYYLPAGQSRHNNHNTKPPPFHFIVDDVPVPVEGFGGRHDLQPTGPYEAEAGSPPFTTKHAGNVACGRLGNANRTPFKRTGRPAVCMRVSAAFNESSPATRALVSCLLDATTSTSERELADSASPFCLSVHSSDARVKTIVGGSERFRVHLNSWTVRSSLYELLRTGQARALFCWV